MFATGESIGGQESHTSSVHSVSVKRASCDLVIMNPPFTRPTNHESQHSDIPIPSFAGFSTSHDEQYAMQQKLKKASTSFGSGHAGLASNFMDLAHRKLKGGGVMAVVLPFALVRGKAWSRTRTMLEKHYSDIHIVIYCRDRSDGQGILGGYGHVRVSCRSDQAERDQALHHVLQPRSQACVSPRSHRSL